MATASCKIRKQLTINPIESLNLRAIADVYGLIGDEREEKKAEKKESQEDPVLVFAHLIKSCIVRYWSTVQSVYVEPLIMVDRLVNTEANSRRIANVESCFGASGQPLAVPGRVLVGEGVLIKMCRKKPKPRQFFLFNDILVYGNILISKRKYNKQHIIPLEDIQLEDVEDDGELRNGWLIKTRKKSFAVFAATSTEKREWVVHINRCIDDLLTKSGKKPATEHAAVWVPDSDAPMCMQCKKTQFGLMQRRHHCRKCGAVVCGPCSDKRFLLPSISRNPSRVCRNCFESLMKAQTRTSEVPAQQEDAGSSDEEWSSPDEDEDQGTHMHNDEAPTFYREN